VTVCIAAIGRMKDSKEEVIVGISDTKLSAGGYYSQEMGAMKVCRLHNYWFAMVAGKFSQHRAIAAIIRDQLLGNPKPTLAELVSITTAAYISETKRFAEERVISRFGLSMTDFLASRKKIGDSLFERTWVEISQIQVECDLLVFGYDNVSAHIFGATSPTTDKPTYVTECDSPSFAAIGSGAFAAESLLYSFRHINIDHLPRTIYETCAAKFFSESASDVGELTLVHILRKNGDLMPFDLAAMKQLKELWKQEGSMKESPSAIELIKQSISQKSEQGK
jgi:hypothetical protein